MPHVGVVFEAADRGLRNARFLRELHLRQAALLSNGAEVIRFHIPESNSRVNIQSSMKCEIHEDFFHSRMNDYRQARILPYVVAVISAEDVRNYLKPKLKGRTQADAAKDFGVSQPTVSRTLNPDRKAPDYPLSALIKMAKRENCKRLSDFILQLETGVQKKEAVTSPDISVRDKRAPTPTEVDVHDQWYGPAISAANTGDVHRRIQLLEQAIERLNAERNAAIGGRPRAVHGARRKKSVRRPSHS